MSQDPYQPSQQFGNVQPAPSNGLGIAGFVVSLVGLIPCGLLCPLGALLSFVAVFRQPRGFAIAGLIIGTLGSIMLAAVVIMWWMGISLLGGFGNVVASGIALAEAQQKITTFAEKNHAIPSDAEGQALIDDITDANKMKLRYRRLSPEQFELRSAGPDKQFETPDDLRVTGPDARGKKIDEDDPFEEVQP